MYSVVTLHLPAVASKCWLDDVKVVKTTQRSHYSRDRLPSFDGLSVLLGPKLVKNNTKSGQLKRHEQETSCGIGGFTEETGDCLQCQSLH